MKKCEVCGEQINNDDTSPSALELISQERIRQKIKGYSPEHDDQHMQEELASAAAFYAIPEKFGEMLVFWRFDNAPRKSDHERIHQLIIAGAFVVAEIERLQRAMR